MAFIDIHESIYKVLLDRFKSERDFAFRPRKTNRSKKLNDGYWFLGNDDYMAIGFWEGMHWMKKTPNIAFFVQPNGNSWLSINTTDDSEKILFVEKYLKEKLKLKGNPGEYNKVYSAYEDKSYMDCLLEFLSHDWKIINNAIKSAVKNTEELGEYHPIGLISREECQININKVAYYRNARNAYEDQLKNVKPSKIKSFEIHNYGPIQKCYLKNIPPSTQWIFLTGENGVGKTSILKALASAIGHRRLSNSELGESNGFKVTLKLIGNTKTDETFDYIRIRNEDINRWRPNTVGFAAYGAMRLQTIYGGLSSNQLETAKSKSGSFNSLFNNDGYLLDLESEFVYWKENEIDFSKRKEEIKELLENAMINIGNIEFSYNFNDIPITMFQEKDDKGNLLKPVSIEKLSSGYMSIVAMMSDMLIRLYKQQPIVNDIADLEGVVLIDEIDIHLHPKFQKHFVEQLTAAFPNVQFIVTTHSAIPLLGAPENSVFCVITRNAEDGVKITRLKKLENEISYLTPNTILTSDIFDFDFFTDMPNEKFKNLYIEDNYDDIEKNREVDERLSKLDKNIFPKDLFKE